MAIGSITRFSLLLWAIVLTISFFLLNYIIPAPYLIDALHGAFVGIAIAVAIVYLPVIVESLKQNRFDRSSQLSIGIGLLWLSILFSIVWRAYFRIVGDPNIMDHPFVGYMVFLAVLGGILFISAPGYYNTDRAKRFGGKNRNIIVGFGLIGAMLSILFHHVFDIPLVSLKG